METPEQIEKALREKLIPRGFSDRGMESISCMIDELAAESPDDQSKSKSHPWWIAAAAAVVIALGVGLFPRGEMPVGGDFVAIEEPLSPVVSLISEAEGVVSSKAEDELVSDEDGRLMKAWRVEVVNEAVYRDGETGHQVRIVRPREEYVLMPVSTF